MALRFHQVFRIFPGVRINLSKTGVSATIGAGPFHVNLGPRGVMTTASIPGTGISYRQHLKLPKHGHERPPPESAMPYSPTVSGKPSHSRPPPLPPAIPSRVEVHSRNVRDLTSEGLAEFKGVLTSAMDQRKHINILLLEAEATLASARETLVSLGTPDATNSSTDQTDQAKSWQDYIQQVEAYMQDLRKQLEMTVVATELDIAPEVVPLFASLCKSFDAVARSDRVWDETAFTQYTRAIDGKILGHVIERTDVDCSIEGLEILHCPWDVPRMGNANGGDLYFYPGFLVFYENRESFAVIAFSDLTSHLSVLEYKETEDLPCDAEVLRHSTGGGIVTPICKYANLRFTSSSGLDECYIVSCYAAAEKFHRDLCAMIRCFRGSHRSNESVAPETDTSERKKPGHQSLSVTGFENYKLPGFDLLDPEEDVPVANHEELFSTQRMIVDTLKAFGIEVTPGDITRGPTITRYEIYPPTGLRVSRILQLEADITRATCAERINILAPIPGKDTVGIEISNSQKIAVPLHSLLHDPEFRSAKKKIPLALGMDIYGKTVIGDLAAMPHLLIAGTTGSGKSVCVNSIIASMLFKFGPDELRFVMVDTKVVEMQMYNRLPHLVVPVVTDPVKTVAALKWVVNEMEQRYRIFAIESVRNIDDFNYRPRKGKESIPDRIPYIVVLIGELADLMQTAPADVEMCIARIAQKARAAGIHLIIATQTPRAEVLTGIIKANIPCRIAFQVVSQLESHIILETKGAEQLLGKGDMIFLPPGSAKLERAQGAYLTDAEIERIIDHCAAQGKPKFAPDIHASLNCATAEDDSSEADEELLMKCIEVVRQERKASTSLLQRRLRLDYTRAARMVYILEQRGIIGPADGAKAREVFLR